MIPTVPKLSVSYLRQSGAWKTLLRYWIAQLMRDDDRTHIYYCSDDAKSYMLATSDSEAVALANKIIAHISQKNYYIDKDVLATQ